MTELDASRHAQDELSWTDPLCMKVRISKPSVGLTVLMSSPFSCLRIVVLPALSSPLRMKEGRGQHRQGARYGAGWTDRNNIRISFSLKRFLRMMVSRPIL